MAADSLEKLEASIGRILKAYATLKRENRDLSLKFEESEKARAAVRDRLDSIIARLEGISQG